MAGAAVECEDVRKVYRRRSPSLRTRWFGSDADAPSVTALDGVDLSIAPDEFVGLAGPSGSGKSTLLHLVAALESPTEGRVSVGGREPASLSGRERTRFRLDTVGVVFQHFHLLSSLSARANVALPLVERGIPTSARRERAEDLLEQVGLGDRTDHRPPHLSGGEQQRVAIARALVTDPPLLVADEPTGELDSRTAERVLDVLSTVGKRHTVVLASHDRQALQRADRVVSLQDGQVVERSAATAGGAPPADGQTTRADGNASASDPESGFAQLRTDAGDGRDGRSDRRPER